MKLMIDRCTAIERDGSTRENIKRTFETYLRQHSKWFALLFGDNFNERQNEQKAAR